MNERKGRGARPQLHTMVSTYVTAADYFPGWRGATQLAERAERFAEELMCNFSREAMMQGLATLNKNLHTSDDAALEEVFLASLDDELQSPLRKHLKELRAQGRDVVLFSRQGALFAMRFVLRQEDSAFGDTNPEETPVIAAGLLVHLLAIQTNVNLREGSREEAHAAFTMEAVRSQLLHTAPPPAESIGTTRLLWKKSYMVRGEKTYPWRLLSDALGGDPDALMATAFGLYASVVGADAFTPPRVALESLRGALPLSDPHILDYLSADAEALAGRFSEQRDEERWDFLPFVQCPVLRREHDLLVLDGQLLLSRITNGLFWQVHDFVKAKDGNLGREKWVALWARMVEEWVEETVVACAGDKATWFTEESFPKHYKGPRADLGIMSNNDLAIFEIFSGSTTVGTRFQGDFASYSEDVEKMVVAKLRQVSGTLDGLRVEGGFTTPDGERDARRAIPLVVLQADFPISPFTYDEIVQRLHQEGLLRQAGCMSPGILMVHELEFLAGYCRATKRDIVTVLRQWRQAGAYRSQTLTQYVTSTKGLKYERRAEVQVEVDAYFEDVMAALLPTAQGHAGHPSGTQTY